LGVFFDSILGWFSLDMGIDLGTCNTLVCVRGEGIVLNEPSVVAVKKGTNRVLQDGNAVGLVAKEMLGKTPGSITAIRPLKDGVISDFEITEAQASMIVDIGGGTTEVAIMSLADIAVCESIRVAGDDFDESIVNHMKKTYNLMIGDQFAEKIKIEIGSAGSFGEEKTMEVRGRDMISGLPRKCVVTSEEIREALQEPVGQIIDTVTRTLERAEPELAADLVENGIVLAGGGALLRSVDKVIHRPPASPSASPMTPSPASPAAPASFWKTSSSGKTPWNRTCPTCRLPEA